MGQITIDGSTLGNALSELLIAPDIVPGDALSYETAKIIWLWHPLGKKMVEGPIILAQSQQREIAVPMGPEEDVREQFLKQWEDDRADDVIYNFCSVARAYGLSSLAIVCEEVPANQPLDPWKLPDYKIGFSVFDPLNTAGSLVLNQDPNSIDFMKFTAIAVNGQPYHRSRTVTIMNERPVYISYTTTAYGFVGRSVFQRALFPLRSFVQTMVTDDLVSKKAGVLVAALKTAGAIIDRMMQATAGLKRLFVKEATVMNANVISIGVDERIETLNMQNLDGAYGLARTNILENIASAGDMPAILLKQETFAEGFGEGTEDAKHVARFIDAFRRWMRPAYKFMDDIIMYRAWNKDFYEEMKRKHPEYMEGKRFKDAFMEWRNSFVADWPSLLTEPDSEKVKVDDVKLKAIIAVIEVLGPMLDPENKATLVQWAQDNINENKLMFQSPMILDTKALADYEPPQPAQEPGQPKPFAASDNQRHDNAKTMPKLSDERLGALVGEFEAAEGLRKFGQHAKHGKDRAGKVACVA